MPGKLKITSHCPDDSQKNPKHWNKTVIHAHNKLEGVS